MSMGGRRFLNLVVDRNLSGLYSLSRIPVSRLFYPSTEEATVVESQETLGKTTKQHLDMLEELPQPMFTFKATPMASYSRGFLEFASLLGDDENKIIVGDHKGHTLVFDADDSSSIAFPNLTCAKFHDAIPISIKKACSSNSEAVDGLYVMPQSPSPQCLQHCFEVLDYSTSSFTSSSSRGNGKGSFSWRSPYWRSLPPPPFANFRQAHIDSYTVVDGSKIYISRSEMTDATYEFDTVGNWTMPFHGKAEYVPDLKLWFGLSPDHPYTLCAFDLLSINDHGDDAVKLKPKPPTVHHTWVDLAIPKSCLPCKFNLINLGSGRLCVVKMLCSTAGDPMYESFYEDDGDDTIDSDSPIPGGHFAVFTGLHMVRSQVHGMYVSSNKSGTHDFDTVAHQWRSHVGRNPLMWMWTMPFSGRAEYVPELKLWFGLSGKYRLGNIPTACVLGGNLYTWLDLDIPKCWSPVYLRLISLGSGRFCVAKIFGITRDDLFDSQFAVLTGLHMVAVKAIISNGMFP
uniref:Uncharacterized protein n=1 Tax=Leersia perrieri TaxID=77586 RepID=A0A0D9XW68_9ORYZ